jgi:DNA transposition AAA+ family ATPase
MDNVFIKTRNFQNFQVLCEELRASAMGIELAAAVGPAGRGKSTAAERTVTMNPDIIYILYKEADTYLDLLREIFFVLTGSRPRFKQACFEIILNEMAQRRRVIVVDDADRMNSKCLNGLRNIHDICRVPVLLVGEEKLTANLARERRLISRTRQVLQFDPVSQADVSVFYRESLKLAVKPELAGQLLRHSQGDFRVVLKDAISIERKMKASGLKEITAQLVANVCKSNSGKGYEGAV